MDKLFLNCYSYDLFKVSEYTITKLGTRNECPAWL
jgi:hypothetical protein